jgi:preprotein translocase subunit SecY
MSTFFQKLKTFFLDPTLRKRLYFTVGSLLVFRLLAVIPIPGIDTNQLQQFFSNNQFFGLLNIFSGGGLAKLSLVMLGVGPFITGSIIMQLLTIMSPRLKQLYQEEGDSGRRKFAQYSRILTVPLAIAQGFAFLILLERQGVISQVSTFGFVTNIIIITAGSILLTWIGELINEFGIGNGVSLIIFAGIVAALPSTLVQLFYTYDPSQIPTYLAFLVVALIVTLGVVLITEAERPIPITYAKRVRGARVYGGISTYLPLRLNQAGVIPIIFALSILLFPQMIFNFLANTGNVTVQLVSKAILTVLNNGWFYAIFYFLLVFVFTYFYTAVTFDPHSIAENLQKSGAFVPGVRPGQSTMLYISHILTRLTLVGALFLGLIAVLPLGMKAITGIAALTVGGTSLLIVVSVVIDFVKRIDAQLAAREY